MSDTTVHTIGIIMNGVTGRMGLNQHLRRSIHAIMQQGGVQLSDSETIMPRPLLVGRNAGQAGSHRRRNSAACPGPPIWTRRWPTPRTPSTSTPRPPTGARRPCAQAIAAGKHVYCEKPVAEQPGERARSLPPGRARRSQARRGAGQALAARTAEAADAERAGLLRAHSLGARRVRLLGVRRRHGSRAAALLELPQGRRRRHHPRHAVPLALCARQHFRRGEGGFVPGRDPHPDPLERGRPALRSARPTIRPTPRSNWKAASWPISIRRGACACGATTC